MKTSLHQGLHKVRSSHDIEQDLTIEQSEHSLSIHEAPGYFKKYELIGKPPKMLLLHLQRKLAMYFRFPLVISYNPLLSKQSEFVDIPQFLDLREFCLFTQVGVKEIDDAQSVPSTHLSSAMDDPDEQRKERRLRRVNSWKQDVNVSDEQIQALEAYFNDGNSISYESRSRASSFDSDYSDVYEIHDENMLFEEEEETKDVHPSFEDCMSYNPYIRANSQRGGGKPILYKLTGVIHHVGSGCGGHYICFRKIISQGKERWMMFNDIYTKEVQWKDVNTKDV